MLDKHQIDKKIWDVVLSIPNGQVARLANLGRAARRVSPAMKRAPDKLELPWYRVVTANGQLAFPENHPNYQKQRQLLLNEGVLFREKKIDMQRSIWEPATTEKKPLDALLWG